ncbi:phytoene desaturase family protein [Salisediminibacterium beveridgei]|uniref:Phytoene desaturase, neurosporene or lycopene producing / 4,4'-diapolycopene oxidase n=1 Tax=Salisediminibacterium beveridgei TaxID=632773 RepID=A0A1D7QUM6_9BACI|nr:phytoene desaturase family protein [Salisediminibacterium beveridgei]AOM82726.1 Phytoene desaturase, neurosporene or lycopene producing / 4,4'-diapolycopene oxidase [Salisediminibacterium beveridgei]
MTITKKAVIIGGGLGGLSAAISLRAADYEVTILEKNQHLGGKLHEVKLGDASFDFGPNTITMPHVFQNVLNDAGLNPDDYFTFSRLDSHTKNVFADGSSLMFHSDKDRMIQELANFDDESALRYPAYLKETEKLYTLANTHFFHRTFSSWRDYLSVPLAKGTMMARPLETLDHFHRKFFKDERIVSAFNRYATYIGSSPFLTPATFGLIGHLEMSQGVFYANGGNHTISDGFAKACKDLGIIVHTGCEVISSTIQNGAIQEVLTQDGNTFSGDAFVLNGDLLTQSERILGEHGSAHMTNKPEPSVSAFVVMASVNTRFDLHHHQVFFGQDPSLEFDQLFRKHSFGEDPTIYICTSSKSDPAVSPSGDNLFILLNAPPLQADLSLSEHPDETKKRIYKILSEKKISIEDHLITDQVVGQLDIAKRFHAYRGALYGLSSNRQRDTFLRPFNKSASVSNLYFAGGSTHPGGGSPMVVLSGKNVANLIVTNHSQIKRT